MSEEIRPQLAPGYDWKKSLNAALKDLAHSLIGALVFSLATIVANPDSLAKIVAAIPSKYAVIAGFGASALAAYARNYLKNREK